MNLLLTTEAFVAVIAVASVAYAVTCNCTGTTNTTDKQNNCPANCKQDQYKYPDGSDFPIQCTLGGSPTGVCTEGARAICYMRTLTYKCAGYNCSSDLIESSDWQPAEAIPKSCSSPVGGCDS